MAWYSDYSERKERLLANGLLVLARGAHIDAATGFVSISLEANESELLRSNVEREFALHITLGYASDYAAGVAHDAAARINRRWAGRLVRLRVGWVGSGGSAQLADDDELVMGPNIYWLHSRGHYGNGVHIRPRDRHVSL